ncbi:MAG: DedA family protein [Xanthomonadaceae bacterium]|nr:DedA family protein [Xanthomonadaceae bacterium]
MLHAWITTWFGWVEHWGYGGVIVLMAMESSIFPVPSEIVMPPAAFWAAQGKMNFWGVVAAGTFGSYMGSAITYWVAQWVGRPFINRYGKYFLLKPSQINSAEGWIRDFGVTGVFIARLLPVIRHLISIPAGIFKMNFTSFSVVTITGAGFWCFILSWFGEAVIGQNPELLQSPAQMSHVIKAKLLWFVAAVFVLGAMTMLVKIKMKKMNPSGARS